MEKDLFINEEIRNDELLKLMQQMRAEKTPEKMLEVLKLAAASDFIVPVDVTADGRYAFHAVGDKKARRFAVAYSDTGSFVTLEKNEDQKGVKASFEDLMALVLESDLKFDGVIINPGASEVIFGRELLESINKPMKAEPVDMKVVKPAEYPPRLEQMIKEFCKDEPRICKVYVNLLMTSDDKDMRWLFGIETSAKGEEQVYIFDTFARFMKPYLQGVEPIVASTLEEYVKQAIKEGKLFYEDSQC